MSAPNFFIANEKDLQFRGIPLNTLVTNENRKNIILTQGFLTAVADNVSKVTNRKLTHGEVQQIYNFIVNSKPSTYVDKPLGYSLQLVADNFLNQGLIKQAINNNNYDTSVVALSHLDDPSLDDYQQREIKQFTKNENQYKFATMQDRRGNAIVDNDRVNGTNSAPDGLKSGKKTSLEELNMESLQTMKIVKNFLDPKSINDLLNRFSSSNTNFSNISLPHQIAPLDSRNRLVTNPNLNEYSWNIHSAGNPGNNGDIKMQDTLQQVIQIKLGSFWLPILPVVGDYYGKIRLLINEFISQSINVTEFIQSDSNIPSVSYYHFEFNIKETSGTSVFLEPVNNTYTFRMPIARVETLTISFRTPFESLIFPSDRGIYTLVYGNPTVLTLNAGTFTLSTGDLVYITNSSSGNKSLDSYINRPSGYYITKLSNNQFSIPLDSSAVSGANGAINVYYGSKRVFFPIEFISLEQ